MGFATHRRRKRTYRNTGPLSTARENGAARTSSPARQHTFAWRETRLRMAGMSTLVFLVMSCTAPRPPAQPATAAPTTPPPAATTAPPSVTTAAPRSPDPAELTTTTFATAPIPVPAPGQRGAPVLIDAELRWNVPRPGCVQMRTGHGLSQVWDAVGQLVTDDNRAGTFPTRNLRVVGHVSTQRPSTCGEHPAFVITSIVGANGFTGAGPLWPE